VTEPRTCEYVVELSTPLVCHPDSMLVFPTLTDDLQDVWNRLEGLREHHVVTEQVPVTRLFVFVLPIILFALLFFAMTPLVARWCSG